jgi:hypothetical protein
MPARLPLRPWTALRRRACSRHEARRGLTLLEVLLAGGLVLILFSAIYAALDQAWRLTEMNRIELERNQIARAVLRRIELDVRAAMFAAQVASTDTGSSTTGSSVGASGTGGGSGSSSGATAATGSTGSTGSSGSASSSGLTTVVSVASSASASGSDAWTGSLGIRGTSTEIWIDLSYARRHLSVDELLSTAQGSDLQTVAYLLSSSDMVAATLADSGATASPLSLQDTDGVGLVRSQGDRSVFRSLSNTLGGGETVLPGPVQMLAPEVQWLQFRYSDGLSWYDEWDSATIGSLPRAVEVTIGLEPPPQRSGFLLSPAVNTVTDSYRLVIAVPVADPLLTEDTF